MERKDGKNKKIDNIRRDESMSDEARLAAAVDYLRDKLSDYDEKWVVGHKGDQVRNLQDLGIVSGRIAVGHVHSTLGMDADRIYQPPPDSSKSYEGILKSANPALREEFIRVAKEGKRVVAFMPFPNRAMQSMIDELNLSSQVTVTAPIADYHSFERIEDKTAFGDLLQESLNHGPYAKNIIPWARYTRPWSMDELHEAFEARPDSSYYFQRTLSAGGDGTIRVGNPEELDHLLRDSDWRNALEKGKIKVSLGIDHAYPANGTGCILPNPDGTCTVLLDPPSHKPVGLKELGAKPGGGVGNDWSTPFPPEIQQQYAGIVTTIGEELYQRYGYTGIFGPDGLIDYGNDRNLYRITEVNPRWQGTTPYQTQNALKSGRLPLELIHYMVKLAGKDRQELDNIRNIIGDPREYNEKSLSEIGGFYIKVGGPQEKRRVVRDLNGPWVYDNNGLTPINTGKSGLTSTQVYSQRYDKEIYGGNPLVWIKSPGEGAMVGGELAPIGYILGSGFSVFDAQRPVVTKQGQKLYDNVLDLLFSE